MREDEGSRAKEKLQNHFNTAKICKAMHHVLSGLICMPSSSFPNANLRIATASVTYPRNTADDRRSTEVLGGKTRMTLQEPSAVPYKNDESESILLMTL